MTTLEHGPHKPRPIAADPLQFEHSAVFDCHPVYSKLHVDMPCGYTTRNTRAR